MLPRRCVHPHTHKAAPTSRPACGAPPGRARAKHWLEQRFLAYRRQAERDAVRAWILPQKQRNSFLVEASRWGFDWCDRLRTFATPAVIEGKCFSWLPVSPSGAPAGVLPATSWSAGFVSCSTGPRAGDFPPATVESRLFAGEACPLPPAVSSIP